MPINLYVNRVELADGTSLIDISDTTAAAADVMQGKFFYSADGSKTAGTAEPGVDCPIFTIAYDEQTGEPSASCNKTFAECVAYRNQGTNFAIVYDDDVHESATVSISSASTHIDYSIGEPVVWGKIVYNSNGNIELVDDPIPWRDSTDLTASGATVTAPAGYYASNATKTVASGTVTAPSSISGTSATVSTGTNTLTLTKTVSVTPSVTTAGYVSSGTAGDSSVSLTASVNTRSSSDLSASGDTVTVPAGYYASQASKAVSAGSATAPASISGTSATVSTGTNTLTLSKTVSVTPTVSAGYVSSGTAGNSSVSLTASVNTRSSSDLTASTLTVTAPSGYYASNATKTLTDSNLVAGNIKKDISIFGVTGNYEGSGGGGGGIVTETVVPEQTVTSSSESTALTFTEAILLDQWYFVTIDGVKKVLTGDNLWGDIHCVYSYAKMHVESNTAGTRAYLDIFDSAYYGTHTVKVEKILSLDQAALGSKTITANGTYNASSDNLDGYSSVTVNVSGGGGTSKNVQTVQTTDRRNNTSLGSIISLTCSTTGTYDVYWTCSRSNTSQTWGSQLYIGGSSYGTENTTWSNNIQTNHLENVSISADQVVAVYGRSRSGYYIYAPQLTIVQK